jgi:predicted transcriptional regulator
MIDDDDKVSLNRQCAAEIVAAYARHNQLSADQLGSVISIVYDALGRLGEPVEVVVERTPAVTIRRSVQHDRVTCLECGWSGNMLRRHLTARHRLTTDEYRARWNLPREHAMTSPAYSERRSTMAKQSGLGRGRRVSSKSGKPPEPEVQTEPQPAAKRRGRSRSKATATAPA